MTDRPTLDIPAPLRLRLNGDALVSNWRALDRMSGSAACGAAIKANGYGLGAEDVATRLAAAGCRDFFVSNWQEAIALAHLKLPISVLHGVREEDMCAALSGIARPVLNTAAQVARWKAAGGGACDVMVDTGMNRLGLGTDDLHLLDGLKIDTLMSHLACADEDSPMNERQRDALIAAGRHAYAERLSLANSAGIALGSAYGFDLTRPGLALYGGVPRVELAEVIQSVVFPRAEVLQRRMVKAGATVGYNATWAAKTDTIVVIVNVGYADGYPRSLSSRGIGWFGEEILSIIGRVSMDLIALACPIGSTIKEGSYVEFCFDLQNTAKHSQRSAYELLTALGTRYERRWF
ncbi:alanine racemase [Sphingomonas rubra]|uniref:alanine racemase n=1 Tax=Sphingomonas rubra TaxID=634430 RepID=A0A1I5U4Y8_9SPHN|nr:alanine racemase [Sphingomonas rubra]SFP89997.1 alanine racemase [Sphingomonas rubra]